MPLLWQQLSISLQKENFKMMSRFKLSNELSKLRISTTDGIPVIQDEVEQDQSTSIQPIPNQTLEEFLKERMEESNQIFENLVNINSHDKEEESFLQEDYVYQSISMKKYLKLN